MSSQKNLLVPKCQLALLQLIHVFSKLDISANDLHMGNPEISYSTFGPPVVTVLVTAQSIGTSLHQRSMHEKFPPLILENSGSSGLNVEAFTQIIKTNTWNPLHDCVTSQCIVLHNLGLHKGLTRQEVYAVTNVTYRIPELFHVTQQPKSYFLSLLFCTSLQWH